MSDLQTTSYQAQELQQLAGNPEQVIDIYRDLPDQFWQYEDKAYNPLDFFTSSGEFNLALFNKTFRDEQLQRMTFYNELEKKRLDELNALKKSKPDLLSLTIGQHLINMKDTPFNIANDLTHQPLSTHVIMKDNRLFYIGLLFIIIFITYLIMQNLITTANE